MSDGTARTQYKQHGVSVQKVRALRSSDVKQHTALELNSVG
jgi:hypothetical protein